MSLTNQTVEQAQIVTQATLAPNQNVTQLALFSDSGEPIVLAGASAGTAVADVAVVDATDEASAVALANQNKATINELLASLRAAGFISA